MTRTRYSYWLEAVPKPGKENSGTDRLIQAMRNEGLLLPEGPLEASVKDGGIVHAEVNPSWGTVEKDDSIAEAIGRLAASFPDFTFTLDEMDEEDKSNQTFTRWENGKLARRGFARLVPANQDYDDLTVKSILDCLRISGADDKLIDKISRDFLPGENEPGSMRYNVSVAVDGRLDIDVYAKSFEDAKEKAMGEFASADLTGMEVIGAHPVNAEAADGTFKDY